MLREIDVMDKPRRKKVLRVMYIMYMYIASRDTRLIPVVTATVDSRLSSTGSWHAMLIYSVKRVSISCLVAWKRKSS